MTITNGFQDLATDDTLQTLGALLAGILTARAPGTAYTPATVTLNAQQAAGTGSVVAANPARKSLMINPPADCFLAVSSGATRGYPLYGNVPNSIVGQECPTNALYIGSLVNGAVVTIWEG